MSQYEIHVTADISYGLRQYLYATDDETILTDGNGLEMAIEIARFWRGRVSYKDRNTVEILGSVF
jgi:trehalose/maltose hydrolase-like predicted phosphorylase